jgi:general secretion pathway protein A
MLARYYGFREDPFGATPDPRCLYQSSTHCEALASLKYGYSSNRGFIALIAPPGMGKTTLLFRFLEDIRQSARTAFVFDIDPQCEPREIVSFILRDIGIVPGRDHAEMHEQLRLAVLDEAKAGRRFVVVIDEAQNLSDAALEVVRMLSNFETSRAKLMQVVLSGQPQLSDKLMRSSMLQLRQRISTFCRIEPLSVEQTSAYIDHRLKFVGYNGPPLFTAEAISRLTDASRGIPRNINNLCFNALSLCCAMSRKQVDGAMVAEAIADQQLMPEAADAPAAVTVMEPAAIQEAEVVPFYRPAPRSGGTRRTWPWVIAGLLIASVLGIFGVSEFRMYRSIQNGYAATLDTTAKSTASTAISWQSSPVDTSEGAPVRQTSDPLQSVMPTLTAVQVTGGEGPSPDTNALRHVEAPQVLDDSTLRDIRARLVDLRRQLSDLGASLPRTDYRIERLQSEIAHLEQQSELLRAKILKRYAGKDPEHPLGEQLVTQAYSQPQGMANPALAHPNLDQPGETTRSLGSDAIPVLLPAASRAKAEAVELEIPTLNAPATPAATSPRGASSFAKPTPEGAVAPGSKE